jgi:hypothetical protein
MHLSPLLILKIMLRGSNVGWFGEFLVSEFPGYSVIVEE